MAGGRLRRELAYFFGAVRFFTRLPVPAWVGHSEEALNRSARYFPAVGLVVGLAGALVFALASFFWPKTLAVLLAMAATQYLTGAFHEDGWSDTVDGLGGGWERERILAIMKDSRIGSYGALALVMLLLGKFVALIELDTLQVPAALLAGHALSRLLATVPLRVMDYAREDGKAKPLATRIGRGELAFAAACGGLPLLLLPAAAALAGLALAVAAALFLAAKYRRSLGGYTGDCLGAVQQLTELAVYVALCVRI